MVEAILAGNGEDFDERKSMLQKEIAVLEYDIPNIRGSRLRVRKEMRLMECRKELEVLQNKCS